MCGLDTIIVGDRSLLFKFSMKHTYFFT